MSRYSEASRALAEALNDGAVHVGDLLINEETGQVLDWGGASGDRLEWLTLQAVRARANVQGWERAEQAYKRAIGHLLTQAGQRSIRTIYGTPRWASRVDRVAKPERVPEVVRAYELPAQIETLIWMTAKALDPKKLGELAELGTVDRDVVRALVEDLPRGPWIQIDAPREAPPEIMR